MSAQTQEFKNGSEKYIPECATVNDVDGRIWRCWKFDGRSWIMNGHAFAPIDATQDEVIEAFFS